MVQEKVWKFGYNSNMNIIGLIFFCMALGMIISNMGRKAEILLHLFLVMNEIIMRLMKYVMRYERVLCFSLIINHLNGYATFKVRPIRNYFPSCW